MDRPTRPHGAGGLLVIALGLAGLTVAASAGAALRDPPIACAGPARDGPGYTRAIAAGEHVVAATIRPDPTGAGVGVAIQFAGRGGPVAAAGVVLVSDGVRVSARATEEVGCYAARVPADPADRLAIAARVAGETVRASIAASDDARPDPALVRRIRLATARAAHVRERIVVRRFDGRPAARVAAAYSGAGYRSRTAGRRFGLNVRQRDWRNLFYWMAPNDPRLMRRVGAVRRGDRDLAIITAWLPFGLWSELLVDPATGAVVEQRMLAAGHNMRSRYAGFAGPGRNGGGSRFTGATGGAPQRVPRS